MKKVENLKHFTKDNAKAQGKKGGIASAKARQERKTLRLELEALLHIKGNQEKLCIALINKALEGDVRAFEIIRDTIGEKPTNKTDINCPLPVVISGSSSLKD